MKKVILLLIVTILTISCKEKKAGKTELKIVETEQFPKPELNEKSANYLYHFAFDCIDQEYPNKLENVNYKFLHNK